MKKAKLLCVLALAGSVGALASCGGSSAKDIKIGVGMISAAPAESHGSWQLELNFATAIYEGNRIVDSAIDVYQVPLALDSAAVNTTPAYVTTDAGGAVTDVLTKRDRHDAYAMKPASPIEKEWYEQAEALENYAKGKTNAEINKTDTALTAGCTMTTDELFAAIAEAETNIKTSAVQIDAGEYTLALGHHISFGYANTALNQVNIVALGVLLDKEGVIKTAYLDEIQVPLTYTAADGATPASYTLTTGRNQTNTEWTNGQAVISKKELKDHYGMTASIAPKGEWYVQAEKFETYLVGKKVSEVSATDTALVADVSMTTTTYIAALTKAVDSALYNSKSVNI